MRSMGRVFTLLISAISLALGLGASSPLEKWLTSISRKFEIHPTVLWVLTYLILVGGLFLLAFLVHFLLNRLFILMRRRRVVVATDTIDEQLEGVTRELNLETEYDSNAKQRLTELVQRADTFITNTVCCPLLAPLRRGMPSIWAIFMSVCRHTSAEVAAPFGVAASVSKTEVMKMTDRSSWGVACVRLLLQQIRQQLIDDH